MTKNLLAILLFSVIFMACNTENKPKDEAKAKKEVTAIPTIDLGDFDTKACDFVGKEVNVSGIVDHVCKHGGKKLLLVSDKGTVHITSDKRFDENLIGKEITVTGIVKEFRVDESYCLKMEKDNIKSHKEGESDKEEYKMKMKQLNSYRDSMKKANTDHLSFYSLEYVSHKENK